MSFTNLGYTEPTPLDPATANVWGTILNENFTLIDNSIAGILPLDVSASVDVVLTIASGAPDQSRNVRFVLTGALTASINIFFPAGRTQGFSVSNQTSGNFNITIAVGTVTALGTTVVAPQNGNCLLYSDGTNISRAVDLNGIGTSTASGIVGDAVNASMTNIVATALGLFTADLIVTGTALNGVFFELVNYNQTLNLGTIGAGGMDRGTAPLSGFVNLYAIYNPSSNTPSILGQNASGGSTTIYSGTHMPAGYTASCLIGIWPTDGSGNFDFGVQKGRSFAGPTTIVVSNGTQTSYTGFTVHACPPGAISVDGYLFAQSLTSDAANIFLSSYGAGTSVGVGEVVAGTVGQPNTSVTAQAPFSNMKFVTTQTLYYRISGNGSIRGSVFISGYSF